MVRNQSSLARTPTKALSNEEYQLTTAAMQKSIPKATDFWFDAGKNLSWTNKWYRAADLSNPEFPKWFLGGRLNACFNCVDRHIEEDRGDQVAIHYESSVTNSQRKIVYSELYDTVSRLSGALVENGVRAGDRVLIFMPSVPQAVFAMLACARIGAIYVPVSGALTAQELAARIDHCKPRVLFTANGGVESYRAMDYKAVADNAMNLSEHKPTRNFVYQRTGFPRSTLKRLQDIDFDAAIRATRQRHQPVMVEANHPLLLEYSSGQNGGALQGWARPTGGHAAALSWTLEHTFGVRSRANETFLVANDADWADNHSFVMLAPLLNAVTTVLYEGVIDAKNCFALVERYACNVVLSSPHTVRAIYAEDPDSQNANRYEMERLRHVLLVGEKCSEQWRATAERTYRKSVFNNVRHAEARRPLSAAVFDAAVNHGVDSKLFAGFETPKVLATASAQAERRIEGRTH